MNKEQAMQVRDGAKQAFVAKLVKLNAVRIAHGAPTMPRAVWSQALVSALIASGAITSAEAAEKAAVVLDSELGNSSQIGAVLVKEGHIKVEEVEQAALSFADEIQRLAQAKS